MKLCFFTQNDITISLKVLQFSFYISILIKFDFKNPLETQRHFLVLVLQKGKNPTVL